MADKSPRQGTVRVMVTNNYQRLTTSYADISIEHLRAHGQKSRIMEEGELRALQCSCVS